MTTLAYSHNEPSVTSTCQHCSTQIALYAHVGWIDTLSPYLGGSYDMCSNSRSGSHEPTA